MFEGHRTFIGTMLLSVATGAATSGRLAAQQGGQGPVQLAFGYECGDRFLLRNDGANRVTVEYNTAGSPQRSRLRLEPRQEVELSSGSGAAMELWVNDKLVAKADRGDRSCSARASDEVIVRPIESAPVYVTDVEYPRQVVYVERPYYYGGYYPFGVSVVLPVYTRFGGSYYRVRGFRGFRGRR